MVAEDLQREIRWLRRANHGSGPVGNTICNMLKAQDYLQPGALAPLWRCGPKIETDINMSCLLVSPDIKSGLTDQISQRPSPTPATDSWPANQHVRMPLSGRDQQGSEAPSLSRAVRYRHDTPLASAKSSQDSCGNTSLCSQSRHRITI